MNTRALPSWGRYPLAEHALAVHHDWPDQPLPTVPEGMSMLARGMGRSYGDSCLNADNALVLTRSMRRLLAFDSTTGVLACEAGATLSEILEFSVPLGWFVPVVPGTRTVTVGGCVANDVHGKNHHMAGSFGNFVRELRLVQSDGRRHCSPSAGADLFRATIGGLGLTGLIDVAEIQLKPVRNRWIDSETIRFGGLDEFFALSRESEQGFDYLVAWVDSLDDSGRGLFFRGNHNLDREASPVPESAHGLRLPFDMPEFVVNRFSVGLFNSLFYHSKFRRLHRATVDYAPFFFPLDTIAEWNRLYGSRGLVQWQCVVPVEGGRETIQEILRAVARSGEASFLTVLKTMGSRPPVGMMSFARAGVTLALDFPRTDGALSLLQRLDGMVAAAGGRLYPAKDARMSARHFQQFYPQWREFSRFVEPNFSSSFWRRVTTWAE